MEPLRVLTARMRALFGRRRLEQRLEEDIQEHLEMLTEENVRQGMTPAEARLAARREFGGIEQMKETYRDTRGIPWIETTLRDARYAARLLRKSPAFTAVAVFVLALGIGATTTVFSLGHTLFSRPLPYSEPGRLVLLGEVSLKSGRPAGLGPVAYPDFADWRSQNQVFQEMAAWRSETVNVNLGTEAMRLRADRASERFFPLLGVQAALGRAFEPSDFVAGAPPIVVLSHALWKANFASRADIAGQTIRVEGRAATVVGVMPAQFRSPVLEGSGRLWIPLVPSAADMNRDSRTFSAVGRLRPGISVERARADMDTIASRLERQYPKTNENWSARAEGMVENFTGGRNTNLGFVLNIAAGFIFLMACANVGNLLLARDAERRKEIALRAAMGAGRLRLVRQFLVESLLLGLAGGAAGLALASLALALLSKSAVSILESFGVERFVVDARVLAFTVAVSLASAVMFGLFSALTFPRGELSRTLNEGSRTVSAGRPRRRLARALVVAELTLALMLLAGAAFILKGVFQFWRLDWGFPIDHRLAMTVSLSESTHPESEQRLRYFRRALQEAAAAPGVRSAALASSIPIEVLAAGVPVKIPDVPEGPATNGASLITATCRTISPEYLRALSIPLLRGRTFTDQDAATAPGVAILNASMARRYWNGRDALGASIEVNGQTRTIVGVAADVINRGLMRRPGYEILLPYTQATPAAMTLLVHTIDDPAPRLQAMRTAIRSIDPDQPIFGLQTLAGLHAELCEPLAIVLIPLLLFGGSALLLATVGIYGIMSHSVSTRSREIGIRMALGAAKGRVVSQILGDGARLTVKGLCLGSLGGLLIMRALLSKVWWLAGTDVSWLLPVALLLAAVALTACYVPAARAARIDPVITLRNE